MLHIIFLLSFVLPRDNAEYNINKSRLLSLVNETRQKGCNCGGNYMPPVPAVTWNNELAAPLLDTAQT